MVGQRGKMLRQRSIIFNSIKSITIDLILNCIIMEL